MIDLNQKEIRFALDAVRRASQLVKQVQLKMTVKEHTKNDRSPVTVADFAGQALVAALLAKEFPNDPLVAEEDAGPLRLPEGRPILDQVVDFVKVYLPEASPEKICDWIDRGTGEPSKRFWTLDPIDGTKGFLRGEQYVVAFGLIVNGQVQIGVMGCPNLSDAHRFDIGGPGSLVIAVKGQGAWTTSLNGKDSFRRLQVSDCDNPVKARILSSVESGHTNVSDLDRLIQVLKIQPQPILMDSQAKHVVAAAGGAELLFRFLSPKHPDYREKIWDQAAGVLIVEESGGRISDLQGKALDFSLGRTLAANRGIIVSNGRLHAVVLEALKSMALEGKMN